MGASSARRDFLLEPNGMWAPPGTPYGSGPGGQVDSAGHNHLPSPQVLKMVGDAFKNAPSANPDGSTGIRAHFDVGGLDAYRSRGVVLHTDWDDDTSTDADEYLVPSRLARGGELIQERACVPRVNGRVDGRQPTPAAKGGTTAPTRWSPATTASR